MILKVVQRAVCLEDWKWKQYPIFVRGCCFVQPPAALCLVRMEFNLNIKTWSWSFSNPLASDTRHAFSIFFPKAITNTKVIYFKTGVSLWWMSLCSYCIFVCVLLLLLVTSNASLDSIRVEMAFWVLYVCTGNPAFVEFESMFIHYSEVLVNGHVPVRVHFCNFSTGAVHRKHL